MKYKYTDHHVHTKWSHDIKENGPVFEDYALIAKQNEINICFLDHYEIYYVKNESSYPFYGGEEKLNEYLEEIKKVKKANEHVLSGLEVDYYVDMEEEIGEFLDNHKFDFDFIAGAVHETVYEYPFTTRTKMESLLKKKSQEELISEFFEISRKMIESGLFQNICHIDTIFRFINDNDILPDRDIKDYNNQIYELGEDCINRNIRIEYNLSGLRHPIRRPFPSREMALKLKEAGAKFFIGSDSHSLEAFKINITRVKEAFKWL